MGASGNIIGGMWTLLALNAFTTDCVDALGDMDSHGSLATLLSSAGMETTSYSDEIGYYAIVIASGLLVMDGCIHLLGRGTKHWPIQ